VATKTLTDIGAVRSAGSLIAPPVTNAISDKQLQSSIRLARQTMLEAVGEEAYDEVADFDETDLEDAAKLKKHTAFTQAEACFAIAEVTGMVTNAQLVATGLVTSYETKDKKTNVASLEEATKVAEKWERAAYKWLAPFLASKVRDSAGKTKAVRSKNGRFYMTSI
jgi:hypothetical protein